MHPEEYGRMYDLEDHYWWFVGRRNLALRLLRKYIPKREGLRILDIGCGTGVVSRELNNISDTISLDMSELALGFCQKRGLNKLVKADGQVLPLKDECVDAVVGLDIYEHIPDDNKAFEETFRVLKPGGILVMSVPAFMSLWGPHDIALMHFRRYRAPELRGKLEKCGFELPKLSYSVFFLFPIVLVVRFFEKRKKGEAKASLVELPGWANSALIALQNIEAALISALRLPWGSSVIAVARKPESGTPSSTNT